MGTRAENEVIPCQAAHFRLAEAGLCRHQKKCMIASSEPGVLIGRSEQRLDFLALEEVHLGPRGPLVGNSQYALDLGSMGRCFERSIAKEGVDCGETQVAAACRQFPMFLKVIEEANDQGRIDGLKRKARRWRVQLLMGKLQQHAKRIAIRTDRVWAGLPLLHKSLSEKSFQQWSETGFDSGHDCPFQ